MNRLKKKAWTELITALIAVIWTTLLILYIAYCNVHGLGWLLLCMLIGVPVFVFIFLFETKELKRYNEREKLLIRKSLDISQKTFILYLIAFSFLSLFMVGGKKDIPVVILPMMVFAGLFLEQCIRSTVLLMQCEKEDDE